MKRFLNTLDKFWFAEAPAARLALLRILIGAFSLWYLAPRYSMFLKMGNTEQSLFEPVGIIELLLGAPLPTQAFHALVVLTLAANIAFLFGWRHKFSGPAFAALLFFVLSYRNSWSMIFHSDNVLVLHVLILGIARAADALSLDALRARTSPAHDGQVGYLHAYAGTAPRLAGDWRYGWPIRLISLVTLCSYFLAGVAKVAGPMGWTWATRESLRSQIAVDSLRKELLGGVAPPAFLTIYDNLYLFTIMAVVSMAVELLAPMVILNKRAAQVWAVIAFLGHWGIFFVMGITFRYQMSGMIFASFFDVERAVEWLRARFNRDAQPGTRLRPAVSAFNQQLVSHGYAEKEK